MSRLICYGALTLMLSAAPGLAQEVTLDFGGENSLTGSSVLLISAVTLLSLAPGIMIMVTCFPFIVTVLSILRQAIGLQAAPPNMLIISLALFLTWFIMEPTFMDAYTNGIAPLMNGQLEMMPALERAIEPFRTFMAGRTNPETFASLAQLRSPDAALALSPDVPLSTLVPSFMLSEIARAFQIGFLIYIPFLVIDLVVSAVLMSMGMMMVPPAVVSLPFKLAFFVVANGWVLISDALVRSYF
ncbi:flagellar type III secretion system pore protein FliP [Thioclava sp. GXIMD2076]|uniref:Flagellar biosynthetic protein FliP n=1 Tax=Thioclava kandeliae TaxID=3070818 RepID=A0ABV1SDS8_9RHOB